MRESNHFGAAAYWAQRIASHGMIGIVLCNATPLVAPWQGKEPRLGTNPICMALPGGNVWLLDMATTTVAMNRIWKAAANGEPTIPAGWAMDKDGHPTTDTQAAVGGSPMPLGGYKGTGLAVMVEILCAVLSGGAMATELGGLRVKGKPMRAGAGIPRHRRRAIPAARRIQRSYAPAARDDQAHRARDRLSTKF